MTPRPPNHVHAAMPFVGHMNSKNTFSRLSDTAEASKFKPKKAS